MYGRKYGCMMPTVMRGALLPPARLAHLINTGAQVGIDMPQLEAALEVLGRDDVGGQQAVPLKIGERLEEDTRAVNHLQTRGAGVALQRIERVGDPMTVLTLRRRDCRVVGDEAHADGDLPRRGVAIRA